jgi:hypothetical protein
MPARPATDATFTMAPSPRSSIIRPNERQNRKGPVRLTSRTRRHCSAVVSSAGRMQLIPALLTRTSTRTKRSRTAAAIRSTSASLDTSPRTSIASAPAALTASAVACRDWMSVSASAYPRPASTSAVRRPMPWLAPVMTATRVVGSISLRIRQVQNTRGRIERRPRKRARLLR